VRRSFSLLANGPMVVVRREDFATDCGRFGEKCAKFVRTSSPQMRTLTESEHSCVVATATGENGQVGSIVPAAEFRQPASTHETCALWKDWIRAV